MSRENVDLVRGGFEAWNTGDMDAIGEGLDPEVVLRPPEGWPEPGPYVGPEAVMRQWAQVRETFDADTLELTTDFIDVGDRVVVRAVWRGAGHGPEPALEMTYVVTVRKGRVLAIDEFWDHDEALEAVGLSEEAVSRENVELVLSWIRACTGMDIDAALELVDPDFEMTEAATMPGAHSLRGHDALRRYFYGWQRNWSDWAWHPDEVIDVPPDRVVVDARLTLRGLRSTAWVERRWAYVFTVGNGRLLRQDAYDSRIDALEAVGLSE